MSEEFWTWEVTKCTEPIILKPGEIIALNEYLRNHSVKEKPLKAKVRCEVEIYDCDT